MLHRRELLQVGGSSFLGMTLPGVLAGQAAAAGETRRAKSVVLVFLSGGGSHIDMFDPKPEASAVKGEFEPIATQIPGVQFSEMMPGLAKRADQLSIVRSMSHGDNRHLSGSHNTLTGAVQMFRGDSNEDKSLNRGDWPCYGSAIDYLQPRADGLPSHVTLPNPLIEGNLVWPGQHAGFLGSKYDPFTLKGDPNSDDFKVSGLSLADGLSIGRLENRWRLLNQVGQQKPRLGDSPSGQQLTNQQQAAYSMLTSSGLSKALQIQKESANDRERYGRSTMGQTLLMARRLVEAEVPVIQCNMGIVQSWDTHVRHFPRLKNDLLPPLDQGVSALLDDLQERSLLNQTLIIVVGEFGRTPTISPLPNETIPGRHHWASAYSAVFAGAGVRGGQVVGKTDATGAQPVTVPWHPNDIGATIYDSLGIDPRSEVHDQLARPIRLNRGKVMDVLFS
ncbi:MAG: DUF1501 domain-containing protein [Planctomycetes bacterium]|nr:DUF1501 domain-containing protein [Planctomycetota bacterium]